MVLLFRMCLLAFVLSALPPLTVASPVAIVNGHPIPSEIFEQELSHRLDPRVTSVLNPDGNVKSHFEIQQALLNDMILAEVLYQTALTQGLTVPSDTPLSYSRQRTYLGNQYLTRFKSQLTLTDTELLMAYNALEPEYRYGLYRIRVNDEAVANNILQQLEKGRSFTTLFNQYSTDKSTLKAGWLGYKRKGQIAQPDFDAIAQLDTGTYSKSALFSRKHWNIYWLKDKQIIEKKPLTKLKNRLIAQTKQKKALAHIQSLLGKAHIERFPEALK